MRNQSLPSGSADASKRSGAHIGLILPFRPSESPANLSLSSLKGESAKLSDPVIPQEPAEALPDDTDPADDEERRCVSRIAARPALHGSSDAALSFACRSDARSALCAIGWASSLRAAMSTNVKFRPCVHVGILSVAAN